MLALVFRTAAGVVWLGGDYGWPGLDCWASLLAEINFYSYEFHIFIAYSKTSE
jgi:hypothetical protein